MGNVSSSPSPAPRSPRRKLSLACLSPAACASSDSLHTSSTSTAASRSSVPYLSEKPSQSTATTLALPPHSSPKLPVYSDSHADSSHAYNPSSSSPELNAAFASFLDAYPEYRQTWILDSLRRSDFTRLARTNETYVDYMGGALFPESLVHVHADFIARSVMGNTHSVSNSSQTSTDLAAEARAAVLAFFDAPPGYTVVFTANATAALKLVGESFPFQQGGAYVLGADAHNSVNGIRRYATRAGADVHYLRALSDGGLDEHETKAVLEKHAPTRSPSRAPALFALTGASNISNAKNPLSLLAHASALGYFTLLDAAALAPTSKISLAATPGVDAMAVSFYKMFGFPTGVGALVVRERFLEEMSAGRPWFAGGTVDVVQVPGNVVAMAGSVRERFEDGTINYLSLPAVTHGLCFLKTYLPYLPLRLSTLTHHLTSALLALRHDAGAARPVVHILSRLPSRRLTHVGAPADARAGSVVSLLFLDAEGAMVPNSFVEYAAARRGISLRTGCVCNPGGAAALLGMEGEMEGLGAWASCSSSSSSSSSSSKSNSTTSSPASSCTPLPPAGAELTELTLRAFERRVGHELGVVRVSLGLASDFGDVYRVLQFAAAMGRRGERSVLEAQWRAAGGGAGAGGRH